MHLNIYAHIQKQIQAQTHTSKKEAHKILIIYIHIYETMSARR